VEYIEIHRKESNVVIGKKFGCSPGRSSQLARDHRIIRYAPRGQGEKKRRKIAKYLRKHTDIQVVENAERLGIFTGSVSTIATKYGLRRQAPKGSGLSIVGRVVRRNGARSAPLAPAASASTLVRRLRRLTRSLRAEGLALRDIAKRCRVSKTTVIRALKQLPRYR